MTFTHAFPARASPGQAEKRLSLGDAPGSRTFGSKFLHLHAPLAEQLRRCAARRQEEAFSEFTNDPTQSSLRINAVKDSWLDATERHEVRKAAATLLDQLGRRHGGLSMAWLMAHEVAYHNDWPHGQASCFMVWHVAGPAKSCDFPGLGLGLVTRPGDAILFDPAQPHGLRVAGSAGQRFRNLDRLRQPPKRVQDVTVYLALDMPWTQRLQERLGVRRLSAPAADASPSVDDRSGMMSWAYRRPREKH